MIVASPMGRMLSEIMRPQTAELIAPTPLPDTPSRRCGDAKTPPNL